MIIYALIILASGVVAYFLTGFFFDVLLRGYSPLIPSRPWVVEQVINGLPIRPYRRVYSLGSGRSGFLHEFSGLFTGAELIGIEYSPVHYMVAKIQLFLRFLIGKPSPIKVVFTTIRHADLRNVDLIYNHLYPEQMANLSKKLKFECRPGTQVVSNGFVIPDLEIKKTVKLEDKPGRLDWLSRDRSLFRSKHRRSIKENNIYYYDI